MSIKNLICPCKSCFIKESVVVKSKGKNGCTTERSMHCKCSLPEIIYSVGRILLLGFLVFTCWRLAEDLNEYALLNNTVEVKKLICTVRGNLDDATNEMQMIYWQLTNQVCKISGSLKAIQGQLDDLGVNKLLESTEEMTNRLKVIEKRFTVMSDSASAMTNKCIYVYIPCCYTHLPYLDFAYQHCCPCCKRVYDK